MKPLQISLLALIAALLSVNLIRTHTAHAAGAARVYVQQAKDKEWTDLQGAEIVGFSCAQDFSTLPNGIGGGKTRCFVATR